MKKGSKAYDYGFLTLNETEKNDLIKKEPLSIKFIKKFMSADDFLNNKHRHCLWLVDATPNELANMKTVKERIKNVKIKRSASSDKGIRNLADTPALFENNQPDNDYLTIPVVSSENREYVPMANLSKDTIVTNACFTFENATLYDFAMLTSKMHMTWMRYTCGRLESRYRYSKTLVYNTYPFPENVSDNLKHKVEKKAQSVLDARKLYPKSSLADLYDPLSMPIELRNAHKELDKIVDKTYGRKFDNDLERMTFLFEQYQRYITN
jgi:glutaredoxin-related protein